MMVDLEIHAGEGGGDAELFAHELANAIGRHFDVTPEFGGRVILLHRL